MSHRPPPPPEPPADEPPPPPEPMGRDALGARRTPPEFAVGAPSPLPTASPTRSPTTASSTSFLSIEGTAIPIFGAGPWTKDGAVAPARSPQSTAWTSVRGTIGTAPDGHSRAGGGDRTRSSTPVRSTAWPSRRTKPRVPYVDIIAKAVGRRPSPCSASTPTARDSKRFRVLRARRNSRRARWPGHSPANGPSTTAIALEQAGLLTGSVEGPLGSETDEGLHGGDFGGFCPTSSL